MMILIFLIVLLFLLSNFLEYFLVGMEMLVMEYFLIFVMI
jgi:hypothetical protein